ncbi:ScbA/BarX family gamma-butyrolactone biosynthesis protein [Kitasatospora sp. NPDC006697]|uniref:ScbA/BarX family gamma-butyrolactone biosynthesis protein n=1 Tax=Kitasatospora sp. NPDC006697 TaxID=3364020 RepID=UPI00368798C3
MTTTVPKELVHRAAVAEVLLTDWVRIDENRFTVFAQWPRSHSFFTPLHGGYHDPLIAAETIRQVGALLAHAEFEVPLARHFLMWDLEVAVRPEEMLVGDTPASLEIDVLCTEVKVRGGQLAALRYETVLRQDGQVVATGGASYTCVSQPVYQRLRGEQLTEGGQRVLPLTAPTAPQNVGRMSPMDVVLSPIGEPNRWQLRVDTRHPVLFDHPTDHVPGMLMVEAARQASHAALGAPAVLPLTVACEFTRFVELDSPCYIQADQLPRSGPEDGVCVMVTGSQNGEQVFSAIVTA